VEIREACTEEAEDACAVIRRSITELCHADHQGDAPTLTLWLANKTAENMRRWIAQTYVFVAAELGQMLGVGAMNGSGEITLNYVCPANYSHSPGNTPGLDPNRRNALKPQRTCVEVQ
jgi:hypothetical protein